MAQNVQAGKRSLLTLFLLTLGLSGVAQSKVGGFLYAGSETFYKANVFVSAGMKYKEFRAGYFYQQAKMPIDDVSGDKYIRHGLFLEVGLFNVEGIAYLSAGLRVSEVNGRFLQVKPHTTIAWRLTKHIEVPITLSSQHRWLTGSIGVRVMKGGS